MSVSWLATTDGCPDWKFGQVIRHSVDPECHGLVLAWEYQVDYNPTESIAVLLMLTTAQGARAGTIVKSYCGWWEPVP